MKCNIFHAPESIITLSLLNTIICPCRGCAPRCQRSEMHKSRGSRGMLPWKNFVNLISRMARMHLVLLVLRQFDTQLIPKKLVVSFDSNL